MRRFPIFSAASSVSVPFWQVFRARFDANLTIDLDKQRLCSDYGCCFWASRGPRISRRLPEREIPLDKQDMQNSQISSLIQEVQR